jgi:hypothetical protein
MEINLTLSVDEINAILQVLGQLPTASNAYPLLMKIKGQAEAQLPRQEEAPAAEEAPKAE